jgi:ABC-type transporter MlaC component
VTLRAIRGSQSVTIGGLRPGRYAVITDGKLTPSGLRILDVTIAGASMAATYRDEFSAVVERNGRMTALIAALRGTGN